MQTPSLTEARRALLELQGTVADCIGVPVPQINTIAAYLDAQVALNIENDAYLQRFGRGVRPSISGGAASGGDPALEKYRQTDGSYTIPYDDVAAVRAALSAHGGGGIFKELAADELDKMRQRIVSEKWQLMRGRGGSDD